MNSTELKQVCREFEREHGIDAFLETMAELMEERMPSHGINVHFDGMDGELREPDFGVSYTQHTKRARNGQ